MAQDYTTIRVTEAAKKTAEQSKRDDETWNEYLLRCSENPPEVREFVDAEDVVGDVTPDVVDGDTPDADELAREVAKRIDYAAIASQVSADVVKELR